MSVANQERRRKADGLSRSVLAALALLATTASTAVADRTDNWFFDNLFEPNVERQSQPKMSKEEIAREEAKLLDQLSARVLYGSYESERSLAYALDRYQQLAQRGGWPQVPTGRTLRVGETDERVAFVRARLEVTDGLKRTGGNAWEFDEYVEAAVKRFQRRHGIPPNGVVDRRTLEQMNVPVRARLEQLRINLVRTRELLAAGFPARYVIVNVPAMELQAVQDGQVQLASRVIVGRPERATPTVHARIKALNFFPYWNVPDSVAFGDLIPKLLKDPAYLQRERIRVQTDYGDAGQIVDPSFINWSSPEAQSFKFRQEPGPQNALGLVRIDMPNEHNVYMHDTPMKNLFGRSARAYSAGCVRVQRVFDLVAWLASANGDWDRARVDSVLMGGQALDVPLNAEVDVFFAYLTAWASQDGEVAFRSDIYGWDGSSDVLAQEREAPTEDTLKLAP
ncbi:MAG: L,D-transpeptidase family protein [Hyphomicrobiaceae bacterium]